MTPYDIRREKILYSSVSKDSLSSRNWVKPPCFHSEMCVNDPLCLFAEMGRFFGQLFERGDQRSHITDKRNTGQLFFLIPFQASRARHPPTDFFLQCFRQGLNFLTVLTCPGLLVTALNSTSISVQLNPLVCTNVRWLEQHIK